MVKKRRERATHVLIKAFIRWGCAARLVDGGGRITIGFAELEWRRFASSPESARIPAGI